MSTQRFWRRYVQLPWLTLSNAWLMLDGRFFFLRNAPDWFVYFLARQYDDGTDSEIQRLCDAGFDERALRRRRKQSLKGRSR